MNTDRSSSRRAPDLKRDAVYKWLKKRLMTGRLRFGEHLSIREISGQTGASRFPVQAAVNDLQQEGFIRVIPQSGLRVVAPTVSEIKDFFLLFSRVEGLLAELAAARRSEAHLVKLTAVHAKIRDLDATEGVSGERYRRLNQALHAVVHNAAQSARNERTARANWAMCDFFISQFNLYTSHLEQSISQHNAVISAIADQDAARARSEMESHIMSFGEDVMTRV